MNFTLHPIYYAFLVYQMDALMICQSRPPLFELRNITKFLIDTFDVHWTVHGDIFL